MGFVVSARAWLLGSRGILICAVFSLARDGRDTKDLRDLRSWFLSCPYLLSYCVTAPRRNRRLNVLRTEAQGLCPGSSLRLPFSPVKLVSSGHLSLHARDASTLRMPGQGTRAGSSLPAAPQLMTGCGPVCLFRSLSTHLNVLKAEDGDRRQFSIFRFPI